jgi:hypothetical protein
MNTNLSTFKQIKYETVMYSLVGPGYWDGYYIASGERKEALLISVINSVKDKSKQISDWIILATKKFSDIILYIKTVFVLCRFSVVEETGGRRRTLISLPIY